MAKWYSRLFKENAYGFGIQVATFIGGVATTLVLPNILGKDGFGYFSLAVGIASSALLFSDCGIQLSVLTFLPKWSKEGVAGGYFRRLFAAKAILSFIVACALFFGADAIAGFYRLPGLAEGLRVGAFYFFFYSMYLYFENVFIGLQKTRVSFVMSLVFHSARVVLPVLIFYYLVARMSGRWRASHSLRSLSWLWDSPAAGRAACGGEGSAESWRWAA